MKTFLLIILSLTSTLSLAKPIKGYADLHVHMFGNLGFAGSWFTGDPGKSTRQEMFKICKEEAEWPWIKKVLEGINPYVSSFFYRNHCVPKNLPFPTWKDLAHQQVWIEDLKKAHEGGLSLMVMSAVHSYILCKVLPDSRKDFDTCEDKDNLLRQLKAANELIKKHDWIEIALSPEHAKKIIAENKLAVVLSIEASNLFDDKNWEKEFQDYYDQGMRTLQFVHQFDNKLSGAAIHKPPLKFAHYLRNWLRYNKWEGFDSEKKSYPTIFGEREVELNKKGLTPFGKDFVKFLVKKGVTIDFAHMSEKTMREVSSILRKYDYPHYVSHGHFRDVMKDGLGKFEKSSSLETLEELKAVNGLFGIRTITFGTHHFDENIQNNCDGSSLSLAQMYQFGEMHKVNMALGSDFNGFISQSRPRFSKDDEDYCAKQKVKKLGKNFDYTGLGKVSQLPDLIDDLHNIGVDTENLEQSAARYIDIWERSQIASQKLLKNKD